MDRLLVMLAVSLLVALAPATRGQGVLPPDLTSSDPGVVAMGPGVPCLTPLPGAGVPNGLPSGEVLTIQPDATVPHGPAGDPMFFDQRGLSELAAGEYEQAIADFDEALRRDPTNAHFYYHRALADFRADETPDFNNFDRALGDLFDAILRDPTQTDHYLARARVFTRMNRFDRARDDYNTVLRNDPANQEAFREREELKIRVLAYNPPADPAPAAAAAPKLDPLAEATLQAAIAEVIARQEKANLDAATYRNQRAALSNTATKPAATKKAAPSLTTTLTTNATNENLKAQIAISKALQVKAQADQILYLRGLGDPKAKPAPPDPKVRAAGP